MKFAILSLFVFYSLQALGQGGGRRPAAAGASDTAQPLERGIAVYVGQVEAAEAVKQLAPFSGRVVRQVVPPGSMVQRGQSVLVLSQKTLGEAYADFTAKANLTGILNEFHVAPGDEFSANQPLLTILDNSRHRIRLAVSNKDHAQIAVNSKVIVTAEGSDIETVGSVYRKSLAPIAGSGLFAVEIDVAKEVPIGSFCRINFNPPAADRGDDQAEKAPASQAKGER